MKVRIEGRDGAPVVTRIRAENYDPEKMQILEGGEHEKTRKSE